MYDIGRICIKLAGRDSNKYCVIVDKIDNNYVLVDGQTRRKKVNIKHLMALKKTISLDKNASHEKVVQELQKLGIVVKQHKKEAKKSKE